RLAIVTNGGGPGVMATDRAVESGIAMAGLGGDTIAALDLALGRWSRSNPIDMLGDAGPDRYRDAVSACLSDDEVDGVLAMLTPQAMTRPQEAASAVIEAARGASKPVLACWMGEAHVASSRALFSHHRLPHFDTPE